MARRTAAEAAQTRRDILDAARTLFAERGYASVSVPDIARSVGMTHGALYHHFSSKVVLFKAVFDEVEHQLNDRVVTEALTKDTPWDSFVAGTRAVIEGMKDPVYQQVALTDAPAVFGWNEWHAVDSGIGLQTLTYGLEMMQADGYLDGVDLPPFATLLFGGLTEAGMQLAKRGAEFDVDRLVDTVCRTVLALSPSKR